jgi:hypothetical protein
MLLFRTGLLPNELEIALFDIAHRDLQAVHISQEFATLLVFAGLITFWFVRHYEQSLFFHWAMTIFWALFGLIHWFDVRGPIDFHPGVLINVIPFVLFLSVGIFTTNSQGGAQRKAIDAAR